MPLIIAAILADFVLQPLAPLYTKTHVMVAQLAVLMTVYIWSSAVPRCGQIHLKRQTPIFTMYNEATKFASRDTLFCYPQPSCSMTGFIGENNVGRIPGLSLIETDVLHTPELPAREAEEVNLLRLSPPAYEPW